MTYAGSPLAPDPEACFNCGMPNYEQNCPSDIAAQPRIGDLTICARCGVVQVYETPSKRRPLRQNEIEQLPERVLLQVAQIDRAYRAVRKKGEYPE